jgi:hypothetical protein
VTWTKLSVAKDNAKAARSGVASRRAKNLRRRRAHAILDMRTFFCYSYRVTATLATTASRPVMRRRAAGALAHITGCALVAASLLGAAPAQAQDQTAPADTIVQRVETAFQAGDARVLLSPAADRLEISLFGARTFYSQAQALYVLRDFFERYPPRRFQVEDVSTTERHSFTVGGYWHTQDSAPLRVYVRFGRQSEAWLVQEVQVQRSQR